MKRPRAATPASPRRPARSPLAAPVARRPLLAPGAPLALLALLLASVAVPAAAEEAPAYGPAVEDLEAIGTPVEGEGGWKYRLGLKGNLSFADNRNVVSQQEGTSATVGVTLDGKAHFRREAHEWRNTLAVVEGVSRTPTIPELVKSSDKLDAESLYLHHLREGFGPFVRGALATPIFQGFDVREGEETYLVKRLDGATETVVADRLRLSRAFEPLSLRASTGAFARPWAGDAFTLESRLGAGFRRTFADGVLVIVDDGDTDELEAEETESFYQVGLEVAAKIWGKLDERGLTYELGTEVLVPFVTSNLSAGDDRDEIELTNVEVFAKLGVSIVEWAGVEYQLRAVRDPQLLDDWQVLNQVLLTFSHDLLAG